MTKIEEDIKNLLIKFKDFIAAENYRWLGTLQVTTSQAIKLGNLFHEAGLEPFSEISKEEASKVIQLLRYWRVRSSPVIARDLHSALGDSVHCTSAAALLLAALGCGIWEYIDTNTGEVRWAITLDPKATQADLRDLADLGWFTRATEFKRINQHGESSSH